MPAKLFKFSKTPPKQKAVKDRQRLDKAFDTMSSGEFYARLSDKAKQSWDRAISNLKAMSPGQRKKFYEENSIWLARVFEYREEDEEGESTPEFIGKAQLGKKAAAFERATAKQYTLNDMKQIAKIRASSAKKTKSPKPRKLKTPKAPKLTAQDIDKQIADLERQLAQLKELRRGL